MASIIEPAQRRPNRIVNSSAQLFFWVGRQIIEFVKRSGERRIALKVISYKIVELNKQFDIDEIKPKMSKLNLFNDYSIKKR